MLYRWVYCTAYVYYGLLRTLATYHTIKARLPCVTQTRTLQPRFSLFVKKSESQFTPLVVDRIKTRDDYEVQHLQSHGPGSASTTLVRASLVRSETTRSSTSHVVEPAVLDFNNNVTTSWFPR